MSLEAQKSCNKESGGTGNPGSDSHNGLKGTSEGTVAAIVNGLADRIERYQCCILDRIYKHDAKVNAPGRGADTSRRVR